MSKTSPKTEIGNPNLKKNISNRQIGGQQHEHEHSSFINSSAREAPTWCQKTCAGGWHTIPHVYDLDLRLSLKVRSNYNLEGRRVRLCGFCHKNRESVCSHVANLLQTSIWQHWTKLQSLLQHDFSPARFHLTRWFLRKLIIFPMWWRSQWNTIRVEFCVEFKIKFSRDEFNF